MNSKELLKNIDSGVFDAQLIELYRKNDLARQKVRYSLLVKEFVTKFGDNELNIFSTPGRTELGGNHTDHNNGKVVAAGISSDAVAVVTPTGDSTIEIYSDGYSSSFVVDISHLDIVEKEFGTTYGLIRGVVAGLKDRGYATGGFKAVMQSEVLRGSGLSSSAAFEVLIGAIINYLYNDGKASPLVLAQVGQYAEMAFFGKPCGLMDQTACAYGTLIGIDFKSVEDPQIEQVSISFSDLGYNLLVVDTGGDHADLTDDYAAIPDEMRAVASVFGKELCRDITKEQLLTKAVEVRSIAGDRAFLRALHFLNENRRVEGMLAAAKTGNIEAYLALVNESGRSSFQYLQNVYSTSAVNEQGVSLALAITDDFLQGTGAHRVHGGGFAGTIQVYVPVERKDAYVERMESVFGKGSVAELFIRPTGSAQIA